MKKSIKIKNNLFRQYRQHGTPELEFKYKQCRNNLNRMLRIAEREHYDVWLSNYKGNLKKSWILFKEVINRNTTRDCSSKFLLNGECITDKLKIANGFNSYFVNVGPNLANTIPDTTISPLNNMNERNAFTFYINPTTETEMISLINFKKMEVRVMIRSQRPQFRKQRLRLLHHLRILWIYLYRLVYFHKN